MIINGTIWFPLGDGGCNIPLTLYIFAKASLRLGRGMLYIKRRDEIIDIQIEMKIKLFGIKFGERDIKLFLFYVNKFSETKTVEANILLEGKKYEKSKAMRSIL